MGSSRRHKSKKKYTANTSSSSSSSSFSSDSEDSLEKRSSHRHKDEKYKRSGKESGREKKKSKRDREHGRSKRRRDEKEKRMKEEKRKKKRVNYESDSSSSNDDESELPKSSKNPEIVLSYIMNKFPEMLDDLKQLLNMIDDGQAVDTRGIPNKTLVKILRKLFLTLNLKETESGVFFLPRKVSPTLEVIGPIISSHLKLSREEVSHSESPDKMQPPSSNSDSKQTTDQADKTQETLSVPDDNPGPRRRVIGPEMPSAELLAAAAKLTEAEAELRDAEVETDDGLFIGPPPPALVAEAASANEAERFEEVTRIMGVEIDSPYDVVGVNWKMSSDNIKKRYWKLSLMVHPDKCSHPQAHQAFIKLNKAFKELQDPEKRKATDEKLEQEEEKAKFKIELKAMREAAQWRRLQGISLAGDDELLEEIKLPPTRDEWMTTLPPEKKPGPPSANMQSTTAFSKNAKEGRGDTSVWTDNPLEKAQRAKMNYLEAYDKAAALAANEESKRTNPDADLVDQYNSVRRSKSLVQKHQEESSTSRPKKKSKVSKQEVKKGEWEGQHPWKPWDREKDLTAGRQKVNLDAEGMVEGLTSRFSSGTIQRNFL